MKKVNIVACILGLFVSYSVHAQTIDLGPTLKILSELESTNSTVTTGVLKGLIL